MEEAYYAASMEQRRLPVQRHSWAAGIGISVMTLRSFKASCYGKTSEEFELVTIFGPVRPKAVRMRAILSSSYNPKVSQR